MQVSLLLYVYLFQGPMAEWSGTGLQNLSRRFDSASDLTVFSFFSALPEFSQNPKKVFHAISRYTKLLQDDTPQKKKNRYPKSAISPDMFFRALVQWKDAGEKNATRVFQA